MEVGNQRVEMSSVLFYHKSRLFVLISHGGRSEGGVFGLFYKDRNPILKISILMTMNSPQGLFFLISTPLELRFQQLNEAGHQH